MKNKDSKARMQMIFGILLFAFIFMEHLYIMPTQVEEFSLS